MSELLCENHMVEASIMESNFRERIVRLELPTAQKAKMSCSKCTTPPEYELR